MEKNVASSKHLDLNDEDVDLIERLVDALDRSTLDSLSLKTQSFSLQVGKTAVIGQRALDAVPDLGVTSAAPISTSPQEAVAAHASGPAAALFAQPAGEAASEPSEAGQKHAGLAKIVAPCVGKFYSRPDPSSEQYVSVGTRISRDTTIGLIEVMKLFNAITAEVEGEIVEICVSDGDLVQNGTVLMYVR